MLPLVLTVATPHLGDLPRAIESDVPSRCVGCHHVTLEGSPITIPLIENVRHSASPAQKQKKAPVHQGRESIQLPWYHPHCHAAYAGVDHSIACGNGSRGSFRQARPDNAGRTRASLLGHPRPLACRLRRDIRPAVACPPSTSCELSGRRHWPTRLLHRLSN